MRTQIGLEGNSQGAPVVEAVPTSAIPATFTYPPKGIQEIQYSVSPTVIPTILGGYPREKRSTRMPAFLATRKWPSSCTKTSMPRATTK
jgi:hypothetical protein